MRYAFSFDASACTGCKACQVACKDKNRLPDGILWRRVYEVSGGEWTRRGAAWTNTVFAYNVSIGCNHCVEPACAAACPADAYTTTEKGLVVLDSGKCIGCEYCAWACPYGAPQFSADLGRTTKCDFCRDLLDAGLSPACVAACPMRALDVRTIDEPIAVPELPFPLGAGVRAQPQIAIVPHRAMASSLPKAVANREEVRPAHAREWPSAELPLVAFTVLGQAAAGLAVVAPLASLRPPSALMPIGALLAMSVLFAMLHLGRARSAWRAPANIARSALSREVVLLGVFAGAWIVTFAAPSIGYVPLAVCGAALVDAMARVYWLDAMPPWNSWRTHAAFTGSALLLGCVGIAVITAPFSPPMWWFAIGIVSALGWSRSRFYAYTHRKLM